VPVAAVIDGFENGSDPAYSAGQRVAARDNFGCSISFFLVADLPEKQRGLIQSM